MAPLKHGNVPETRVETLRIDQKAPPLNLPLAGEIDQEAFTNEHSKPCDRPASIKWQLNVLDRSRDEATEQPAKKVE